MEKPIRHVEFIAMVPSGWIVRISRTGRPTRVYVLESTQQALRLIRVVDRMRIQAMGRFSLVPYLYGWSAIFW